MKKLSLLAMLAVAVASGCSSNTTQDNFREASFELCNTEVSIYSVSDDGKVRIVCADGAKFALQSENTLETMRQINIDYCDGEGLGKFSESSSYYLFKCKSGTLLSIAK
ncbi:hypothetical protein KW419_19230 [Vibrio fluvialis]|jgi:hypothetical protein|uniref:Lipoprotein n=1 Tax=Vibrio fluvialis PG41 TaxID=1336752 RepID=S7IC27_VIBFL|nr:MULTISPECIES: hypothetical protein [Vibrio]TNF12258.1 MAG: hypothetical protein EP325_13920 [Vibrionaceae bacterium]EKO3370069.1 hypothetical protein [Vibrio fluvialis]EKO3378990.1 hypothetical protein [Vibrio fluvialis]EKO3382505.1 hypothetical protein [Vibrio fluvialis]EKO3387711.1 hypothetical protein [Vibrio fluvialis]